MRHTTTALILSLICSLGSSVVLAANEELDELQTKIGKDWVAVKNDQRHGFKTYAKQEDGKRFRSFKAEAVFDSSMETFLRMVTDFDNMKKWTWHAIDSKLLKKVSPTEYYFYVTHDSPYGVPDRDVALHMVLEPQTKGRNSLTMMIRAVPDYIPEKPPFVRMLAEEMNIKITPIANGKIHVVNEGYVDPGGNMASWAINFVQRSGPYATLLGMRRILQQPELTNSKTPLPFAVYNFDTLSQIP
jgi:hypothetical protein